jgi:hypothetical protein
MCLKTRVKAQRGQQRTDVMLGGAARKTGFTYTGFCRPAAETISETINHTLLSRPVVAHRHTAQAMPQ